MTTRQRLAISSTIASLAASCGEMPVSAVELEGMWVITSSTSAGETIPRVGARTIRADLTITPVGERAATLDVRQILLESDLMVNRVSSFGADLALEPGRWVLDQSEGVTVYDAEHEGDHVVLSYASSDPRNNAGAPPSELILDRIAPWTTALEGRWRMVSLAFGAEVIEGDSCVATFDGRSRRVGMWIALDARLLFEETTVIASFDDTACAVAAEVAVARRYGFAEEVAPHVELWSLADWRPIHERHAFVVAGDIATLTREHCLPLPACETLAPSSVVMRRE